MIAYASLLAEAQAEFDSWDRGPKTVVVGKTPDGSRVWFKRTKGRPYLGTCIDCGAAKSRADQKSRCTTCKLRLRASKYKPCACGEPYYARGQCKKCYNRDYSRQRVRNELQSHAKTRVRKWQAAHPDKMRANRKRYEKKHPGRRNQWRIDHPEQVREMKRKQAARYKVKYPEKYREKRRKQAVRYKQTHREQFLERRRKQSVRYRKKKKRTGRSLGD